MPLVALSARAPRPARQPTRAAPRRERRAQGQIDCRCGEDEEGAGGDQGTRATPAAHPSHACTHLRGSPDQRARCNLFEKQVCFKKRARGDRPIGVEKGPSRFARYVAEQAWLSRLACELVRSAVRKGGRARCAYSSPALNVTCVTLSHALPEPRSHVNVPCAQSALDRGSCGLWLNTLHA